MLDSRTYVTEKRERTITIRGAGALAAGLLLVLVQANACSPVKSPSEPSRAETPLPREAQQTPAAPPLVEQPQPMPPGPLPKSTGPEQPKPAEPQPKAAEPSQPKPAAPPRPKPPEPPRPKESATAPPSGQERAAILDMTSLEKRLRDTSAIGVFTKLSLKNEVDDLLERFRSFHEGRGGGPLAKLRENYDLLVLKVVSLLQDKDSALARDISTSREALWNVLKDPAKFKTL
jgi:hypothetical protein